MVEVKRVEETYFRCQACYGSRDKDGKEIKKISIGVDPHQMNTIRLCTDCQKELVAKLNLCVEREPRLL